MIAALAVGIGLLLLAALGRLALVSGHRVEASWRLPPAGDDEPDGRRSPPEVVAGTDDGWSLMRLWRPFDRSVARFRTWWRSRPARADRQLAIELPALLDDVSRSLRSGTSLRQALAEASTGPGGAAASLARVVAQAERGQPLDDALAAWVASATSPDLRLAGSALRVAIDAGGGAARALDAVIATLRERGAAAEEVRVQSVQARLSAVVIALLPIAFTAWCVATDERAAAFLFASPAGWCCLAGGVALLAAGAWWMARIIRSVR
jgi:tight adherence protein B